MELMLSFTSQSSTAEMPQVICGFPGVGKSTLFKQCESEGMKVLDSDSSKFDKSDFPANYIKHIQKSIADGYTILASSHQEVRDALVDAGIKFVLAYPDFGCKDEYLERYRNRGSDEKFVNLLDKNWEAWLGSCRDQSDEDCFHHVLSDGEFLNLQEIQDDLGREV